jgi:hypothetical protein
MVIDWISGRKTVWLLPLNNNQGNRENFHSPKGIRGHYSDLQEIQVSESLKQDDPH